MPDYRAINSSLQAKTTRILHETMGEYATVLIATGIDQQVVTSIAAALGDRLADKPARDVGFHLTDWMHDNAFLIALHLRPNDFTPAEVRAGVTQFLIHAPNHLAAAAKIIGHPVADVFNVGALDGDSGE